MTSISYACCISCRMETPMGAAGFKGTGKGRARSPILQHLFDIYSDSFEGWKENERKIRGRREEELNGR